MPDVRLRIMQPNLPQDAKFNPRNRERHHAALPRDQRRARLEWREAAPTHIIWPESAFPFLLHRDPASLAQIAALLGPGSVLITGAARMDEPLPGEAVGKFYNAIQVIDDAARSSAPTTRCIWCRSANMCRASSMP